LGISAEIVMPVDVSHRTSGNAKTWSKTCVGSPWTIRTQFERWRIVPLKNRLDNKIDLVRVTFVAQKKGLLTIADENGIVRRESPASCHHEIAKRPSDGCGTMRVLDLIWVRREAKYFLQIGFDGQIRNLPVGQITRILPRRHGVGGADERATRSASSLAHPGRLLVRVKEGTKWRVPFGDGTQRVARC
jgi:hypothetical protein